MNKIIIFAIVALLMLYGAWRYAARPDDAIKTSNEYGSTTQPAMQQEQSTQLTKNDTVAGTGAEAQAGDTVTVHYTGTFADGTKFDSSHDHGAPFTFLLGNGDVIHGWDLGVQGMKIGGTRMLVIPPALGYGSRANGPIPPNSTLYFTIELLAVEKGN